MMHNAIIIIYDEETIAKATDDAAGYLCSRAREDGLYDALMVYFKVHAARHTAGFLFLYY